MKTFRFFGAAILAVAMCVNFTSCSDDPFGSGGGNGDIAGSKKLTKIVSENEFYTFEYDNDGHLVTATETDTYDEAVDTDVYEFIWGEDAIRVKGDYDNYTLTLSNGLVQSGDDKTYSYNSSNRFVKGATDYYTTTVIWNGDKMVSIEEDEQYGDDTWAVSLTYGGETCKKGYMPLIPYMVDFGCDALFMAHPEIVGMRTQQLPATYKTKNGTISLAYTYDKEGYVTKIDLKLGNETMSYTFTWE